MVSMAVAAGLNLAAGTTNNNQGGQGQEFGSASPIALVLLIVLLVAVGFLIRSMSKHLKKVPATFDPEEQLALDKANAPAEPEDPAQLPEAPEDAKTTGTKATDAKAEDANAEESVGSKSTDAKATESAGSSKSTGEK
jgi:hypothetical protein